jgi:hypothetical protein
MEEVELKDQLEKAIIKAITIWFMDKLMDDTMSKDEVTVLLGLLGKNIVERLVNCYIKTFMEMEKGNMARGVLTDEEMDMIENYGMIL